MHIKQNEAAHTAAQFDADHSPELCTSNKFIQLCPQVAALGIKQFVKGGSLYDNIFPHKIGLPLISLAKLHNREKCHQYLMNLKAPDDDQMKTDSYLTRSAVKRKIALCGWESTDIVAAGPAPCGLRDMVPWCQVLIVGHLPIGAICKLLVTCKVGLFMLAEFASRMICLQALNILVMTCDEEIFKVFEVRNERGVQLTGPGVRKRCLQFGVTVGCR